jgi:cytochrome c biogenesis protein CcdA
MNEKGYKTARNLAGISEFVGLIFCVLGVVSGIYSMLNSAGTGFGNFVQHILTSECYPTVAGGLLLIVAGRILQVVIDNSEE